MSPGGMNSSAALAEMRVRMKQELSQAAWTVTDRVGRDLRAYQWDIEDLKSCFLEEQLIPENAMGKPSKKPDVEQLAGTHYGYRTKYDGRDLYLKFRVTPEDVYEVTSFHDYSQF